MQLAFRVLSLSFLFFSFPPLPVSSVGEEHGNACAMCFSGSSERSMSVRACVRACVCACTSITSIIVRSGALITSGAGNISGHAIRRFLLLVARAKGSGQRGYSRQWTNDAYLEACRKYSAETVARPPRVVNAPDRTSTIHGRNNAASLFAGHIARSLTVRTPDR